MRMRKDENEAGGQEETRRERISIGKGGKWEKNR
jgi:hypothetical protein